MARIRRFGEQMLVFRVVFIGPQVFKNKPENDSDITRTSQPTRSRPVVCVGLITCLELARKTHARGGHCHISPINDFYEISVSVTLPYMRGNILRIL